MGNEPGNSEDWLQRDLARVWHGFTQMTALAGNEPIIVDHAEGRFLFDTKGSRYLDAISSLWVNTLGHRVPELDAALALQASKVAHSTLLGHGNTVVVELSERLAQVVPVDDPHFLYASDGACAAEQAIKIAFQYWTNQGDTKRNLFMTPEGSYHGDTIGSLSVAGGSFGTHVYDPLRFKALHCPSISVEGWEESAIKLIEENSDRLAAVLVEPLVQGAAGIVVGEPEAFRALGEACSKFGVLLICDEVATGFGRTGTLFASEACSIRPDIMALGKGITGGYLPMSATAVSAKVYNAFLGPDLSDFTFYHGHSYGGNALCAAVALAHLDLLTTGEIMANVSERSAQLKIGLEHALSGSPLVTEIRIQGLMAGVDLELPSGHTAQSNGRSIASFLGRMACAESVRNGVLLRPIGNTVIIVPILTSTSSEIDLIVSVLKKSLEALWEDVQRLDPRTNNDIEASDPGGMNADRAVSAHRELVGND